MPLPQQIRHRHGTWAQHFLQKSESKHKLALPESHDNPVAVGRCGTWMDTVTGGLSRTQEVGAEVFEEGLLSKQNYRSPPWTPVTASCYRAAIHKVGTMGPWASLVPSKGSKRSKLFS